MNELLYLKIFFLSTYIFGYSACGNHIKNKNDQRSSRDSGSLKSHSTSSHSTSSRPLNIQNNRYISTSSRAGKYEDNKGKNENSKGYNENNKEKNIKTAYWPPPLKVCDEEGPVKFRAPDGYPADVSLLMEHYHLMYPMVYPVMRDWISLEEYFSRHIHIIKNPPKDENFVTNVADEWDMCVAASRNGVLLPKLDYILTNSAKKVKINVKNVENGDNVPAVRCFFKPPTGHRNIEFYITNGPRIKTYFIAVRVEEDLTSLQSFFHQYRDSTVPKSTTKVNAAIRNPVKIRIYGKSTLPVCFEVRKLNELEAASKNVMADMVKRHQDKFNNAAMYRYFPEPREDAINYINRPHSRFILAKVDGVIVGMAAYQFASKLQEETEIKYFVENEFQSLMFTDIFEMMMDILIKSARDETKEGHNWRLFILALDDNMLQNKYLFKKFDVHKPEIDKNGHHLYKHWLKL